MTLRITALAEVEAEEVQEQMALMYLEEMEELVRLYGAAFTLVVVEEVRMLVLVLVLEALELAVRELLGLEQVMDLQTLDLEAAEETLEVQKTKAAEMVVLV